MFLRNMANIDLVQFRVTRLDVGIVLVLVIVIGFSAFSITITSTASLSTRTGQTDCYPYALFSEPGPNIGMFAFWRPCFYTVTLSIPGNCSGMGPNTGLC